MPTYRFSCVVGVSAYTIVEAENEQEAREIAEDREPVIDERGEYAHENWCIGEPDGTPRDIDLEKVT